MTDPRIASFNAAAEQVLTHLKGEYSRLQTGRANPSLVEHLEIEAYGQKQQLRSLAGITIPEPRTIVIQPWDRGILQAIEKAIQVSNLGVSGVNDGVVIRINLPAMNQENRQRMAKLVHQLAEEGRIAVRKHRQTVHDVIKQEKDEDVKETLMEELQKAVDGANEKIADLAKKKEEEIMKI